MHEVALAALDDVVDDLAGQLLDRGGQHLGVARREAAADEQLEAVVLGRVHRRASSGAGSTRSIVVGLGHHHAAGGRAEQPRLAADGADVGVAGDRPEARPVDLRVPVDGVVRPQPGVLRPTGGRRRTTAVEVRSIVGRCDVGHRAIATTAPSAARPAVASHASATSSPRDRRPGRRCLVERGVVGSFDRRDRPVARSSTPASRLGPAAGVGDVNHRARASVRPAAATSRHRSRLASATTRQSGLDEDPGARASTRSRDASALVRIAARSAKSTHGSATSASARHRLVGDAGASAHASSPASLASLSARRTRSGSAEPSRDRRASGEARCTGSSIRTSRIAHVAGRPTTACDAATARRAADWRLADVVRRRRDRAVGGSVTASAPVRSERGGSGRAARPPPEAARRRETPPSRAESSERARRLSNGSDRP